MLVREIHRAKQDLILVVLKLSPISHSRINNAYYREVLTFEHLTVNFKDVGPKIRVQIICAPKPRLVLEKRRDSPMRPDNVMGNFLDHFPLI